MKCCSTFGVRIRLASFSDHSKSSMTAMQEATHNAYFDMRWLTQTHVSCVCVCVCVCVYIYIYTHMCIYIYIHTHIHTYCMGHAVEQLVEALRYAPGRGLDSRWCH
jgi:hypothetical protein